MPVNTDPRERAVAYASAAYQTAARELLADLTTAGAPVTAVRDLLLAERYDASLVPILVRWLGSVEYQPLREDIIRTLSVPWAKAAAPLLVSEFAREPHDGMRWVIGNALCQLADDAIASDLVAIAANPTYGTSRQMVVFGLGAVTPSPSVTSALVAQLGDTDVCGHAVTALGKLRAASARAAVAALADHPRAWIRREVKKALARIDRAAAPKRSRRAPR